MINPHQRIAAAILVFITFLAIPAKGISQVQTTASPNQNESVLETEQAGDLTMDDLKSLRSAVEDAADLSDNVKKTVLNYVDRAILFQERDARLRQDFAKVKQQVATAPTRIKAIETELERPLPPPDQIATTVSNMKPDEREIHLRKLEADLSDKISNLAKFTDQLNTLKNRLEGLQQEILKNKQQLLDISDELKATPAPDEPLVMVRAQQAALLAQQTSTKTEIELFEKLLADSDAIEALLTAERDLADRQVDHQQALVKNWQTEVQRLRELEAKEERVVAEQAKKLAVGLPPGLQKQYDVAIELGKMLEKITAEEAQIREALELSQTQLTQLEEDFALASEQVQYPLHTETIGLAMREQRRTLPSMEEFRRDSGRRREQMGEIRANLLDLDRQRSELADLDHAVDQIIQNESDLKDTDVDWLKTELRRLLSDRRDIVKKLLAGYQRLFKNLQTLEFIEQQIASKAQEISTFLDEHLLWIRSAKSAGIRDLQNLRPALKWLFSPLNWWQATQHLMLSLMRNPLIGMLGLLIPITFVCLRRWAHRDLSRIAHKLYSVKTDSFALTLRAMALTARAPLGWPLLMGFTGWQLARLSPAPEFTSAVGNGLAFAAQGLASSLFIYEMCWKEGLAKVHFRWPESVRRTIKRNLRWFMPILVTMELIFAAVQAKNEPAYSDSLGRLALITLMLGFFVLLAYVLRFSGEIGSMLIRRRRDGWLVRLRFIWYPLAMGVPLFMALLAAMGYYYSAHALYVPMGYTITLILVLIIVKDLVLRWLYIIQRRLVFEEIKRKREAEVQKQEQEEKSETLELETVAIEEPEINIDQIYEKNKVLLRTIMFFSALVGLWLIWSNVLPALNILEEVKLWSYSSEVDGVRKMIPITLDDLMIAVVIAIVTIVAAKNLPGLLELILLHWFAMDFGARHAFTTIFNYAITALGVAIVFTTIGIKWSNLQWLIAALSVGLGFGLQEIVANFICGLIVLFERPFRIGDTVTIADISGTVTRIQIRATTIRDWDRKELIVPNKEFITGRLINWSLSDNLIRIKIPIGIAYGSDTELAEELLLKAAKTSPLVLDNPEPHAVFMGFGDNSLNFELRVFINSIEDWIPMLHKLNQAVDYEFRKADVTISFPQRDVHLDQTGPLEVRVVSESKTLSNSNDE